MPELRRNGSRVSDRGIQRNGNSGSAHTGTAEDTGHLDELDGLLSGIHLEEEERALSSKGVRELVVGRRTGVRKS